MIEKHILKLIKNNYMASFIILIALFELYLSFKKPLYGFCCLLVASLAFCILNDTIYPFYIFFGAVLINKLSYMERTCVKCK